MEGGSSRHGEPRAGRVSGSVGLGRLGKLDGHRDNSMGIGDLAALFTVAGVAIYVLGLVGLAIPIRRSLGGNISAAWHVVSLIPKTVVAGQGVRIWMRRSLVIFALLILGITVVRIVLSASSPKVYLMAVIVLWLGTTLFSWFYLEDRARIQVRGALEKLVKPWVFNLAIAVPNVVGFTCLLIGVSLFFERGPEVLIVPAIREAAPILVPSGGGPYLFSGIVLFLVGSFFLGLPFALWDAIPLPKVKVTKQNEGKIEGVPDPLEGLLVAHSDGFWHLLVLAREQKQQKQQLDLYEQREFLSVPDATVLAVRTLAGEDAVTSTTHNEATKSEQEKAG